jgi:gluconolactonase
MNILTKLCVAAMLPVGFTCITNTPLPTPAAKVNITTNQTDTTYGPAKLFDAGTQPVMVSKQFEFTEGPASDKKGNVHFTDQPNNAIWVYHTNGQLTRFSAETGRSNGMFFNKKGDLITCADDRSELWSFDAKGRSHTILLKDVDGKRLNGPNDLWIDLKGGIYFTDPYYQRNYWTRKQSELDGEKTYYLALGSTKAVIATSALKKPNGIAGTSDGKHLFVADIGAGKTYKFNIGINGELIDQQLFAHMGSDGMTLDDEGNVYLTGNKGVTILDPQGQKIGLIRINEPWTANVCFGGKNRNVLFITASKAVYTFEMKVKGAAKNAGWGR